MFNLLKKNWILFILTSGVIFIISAIAQKKIQDIDNSTTFENFLKIFALGSLSLIIILILLLHAAFDELRKEISTTKVSYYSIEKAFLESQEIIKNAKDEILIVNSWIDDNYLIKSEKAQEAQKVYFELLLEKAKKGVKYKRIIQLDKNTDELPSFEKDSIFKKHLLQMVAEKSIDSSHLSLKKAKAKRLTTFVLVDRKHLIWQVNEVSEGNGKKYLEPQGAFIFQNDMGEITTHFSILFNQVENNDEGSISEDELNLDRV